MTWRSRRTPRRPSSRIVALDAVRGVALVGMAAYHCAWDLHAFGLVALDPSRSLGWRLLGHGVAALFLALSGFGLELARSRGATRTDAAQRLLLIAAAALLVTLATWLAVPRGIVTFGILHCIVVTNLVALGLERLSRGGLCLIAGLSIAVPLLSHVPGAPAWTGLAETEPPSLDFRPLLPWLAPVLLGMAAGRTRLVGWLQRVPGRAPASAVLAWSGRHSLFIYLVHQPLLVALLLAAVGSSRSEIDLLRAPPQASAFLRECEAACVKNGGDGALCAATCHCVLTGAIARTEPHTASILPQWVAPAAPFDEAVAACRQQGTRSR